MVFSSCLPRFTKHPLVRAVQGALTGWAFASTGLLAPPVQAQAQAGPQSVKKRFDIPPSQLDYALSLLKTQSGVLLSVDPRLTHGKTTAGLRGDHTVAQAFSAVLADSGLELAAVSDAVYVLRERQEPAATAQRWVSAPVRVAEAEPEPAKPPEEPVQEEPVQEEAVQLEPMVVTGQPLDQDQGFKADMQETATKFPLSIRETPQSISVITQDALEARQVIDFGQALETAAGVNLFFGPGPFAGRGALAQAGTQIRGIESNFYADRDEGFVSPIDTARPDLAPYERIEVVKGPSSVLYGRGSAGGFVNRVRKKPLGVFASEIDASVGSFDFYRAQGDVTGPLFASDKARGRLVLAYENAGAFVDGVESELVVAAPGLDLDLTASTRLLLLGSYQRDEFVPNNGIPLVRDGDTVRAPDIRRSLYTGVPDENEANTEIWAGIAQLEQEFGDRWLATLRLNRTDIRQRAEIGNYADTGRGLMPGDGNVNLYSSRNPQDDDVWSGELRLNGRLELLGRPANLSFGVDHTKLESVSVLAYSPPLFNPDDPDDRPNIYEENFADFPTQPSDYIYEDNLDVQEDTGVYGQLQFRPFERLSVLLGGRYDRSDASRDDRLNSTTSEKQDDAYTGRVGLVFDVSQQVSVYGLYAQSFDPVVSAGADGDILEPETGEIFEAGIKTEWLDGKLGVNAALFRLDRQDIPIFVDPDGRGGNPGFSVSSGLQRTDGIELEINGEPLPGWNVSFGGAWSDFEFKEGPFVGATPDGAADWQVGAYTGYELQTGPLKGLGLGASLYAIDDRGVSNFFPQVTGVTVEGYERVDLSLFYNGFEDTKIALQVRNVFDERYIERTDASAVGHFGAPTAVLLTVRIDLDGLGK